MSRGSFAGRYVPGEYYERGLLHLFVDYEQPQPWLHELEDALDSEGYVYAPQRPGLGLDINFDYIEQHLVA
jgi:hypothetical protein